MIHVPIICRYSGTSLIHTSTIQLLRLSGIDLEDILINAHATCIDELFQCHREA